MGLTAQQRNALPALRAHFNKALSVSGVAESVDERARLPDPAHLPTDVDVRVEIAPPSPDPHPLLLKCAPLRTPERVPIYFYSLQNDKPDIPDIPVADTRIIFFIHGGGNIVGHPTNPPFIQFYSQLLRAIASHAGDTKCVLIAPSYRIATVPENAFPAGLQDIVAAYDFVLGKGYTPSNIVVAGDSAGGNHAVVLTHLILESHRPSPGGVVAIAPGANMASLDANARASADVLDPSKGEVVVNAYLGDSGVARTHPLVSGAFVPFTEAWPKTLILIGTADRLIDASHELKRRLTDIKRPVQLVEYDERPHAWWVLPQLFPKDIQDATQRVATFILEEHMQFDSLQIE